MNFNLGLIRTIAVLYHSVAKVIFKHVLDMGHALDKLREYIFNTT